MKKWSIKKATTTLGICLISLSVIMFLAVEISTVSMIISASKARIIGKTLGLLISSYMTSIVSPITYLISGVGFGAIIILIGRIFELSQAAPLCEVSGSYGQEAPQQLDLHKQEKPQELKIVEPEFKPDDMQEWQRPDSV